MAILLAICSLGVSGCERKAVPASWIAFPTYEREGNGDSSALITGRLVERDRCLFLEVPLLGGRRSYSLLIWPDDYRLVLDSRGTPIVDGGESVAGIGDYVTIGGGGDGPRGSVVRAVDEPIPERCDRPPYRFVGDYFGRGSSLPPA